MIPNQVTLSNLFSKIVWTIPIKDHLDKVWYPYCRFSEEDKQYIDALIGKGQYKVIGGHYKAGSVTIDEISEEYGPLSYQEAMILWREKSFQRIDECDFRYEIQRVIG